MISFVSQCFWSVSFFHPCLQMQSLAFKHTENWSHLTNSRRRYMAKILPIRRKTLSNQSINQSNIQILWFFLIGKLIFYTNIALSPNSTKVIQRIDIQLTTTMTLCIHANISDIFFGNFFSQITFLILTIYLVCYNSQFFFIRIKEKFNENYIYEKINTISYNIVF